MAKKKFKILKVTFQQFYLIEMFDKDITEINGWSIDQVIKNWFEDHSLSSYHATRDGHVIGNAKKLVKHEVISESEFRDEF